MHLCFDLARDIDFHVKSLDKTGERAVAGTKSGLIGKDESVTWKARHWGVRWRFAAKITVMIRPTYFQDVMTLGAFKSFIHDHHFEYQDGMTTMLDTVTFRSPLGLLGAMADRIFMRRYLQNLIATRCKLMKQEAESRTSTNPT